MKINKIAATLVPTAVAGLAMSSWAAVQAASDHPSAHAAAHQVREVRPSHPGHSAGQQKAGHQTGRKPAHSGSDKQVSDARMPLSGRDQARNNGRAKTRHRTDANPAASQATPPARPSVSSPLSGMSAFERCVAWRESGDNPTASSAGLFGILPSTWASLGYAGTAGGSSVALQKAAFDRLYAQYGTSPWAPYDGC
jgi:hypothetical protein